MPTAITVFDLILVLHYFFEIGCNKQIRFHEIVLIYIKCKQGFDQTTPD